jgi:dodecin
METLARQVPEGSDMPDSVYTFTEIVGTSSESWEQAARTAVERAAKTLRDLRVAEVVKLDMELDNGQVRAYRARVQISFKLEDRSTSSQTA